MSLVTVNEPTRHADRSRTDVSNRGSDISNLNPISTIISNYAYVALLPNIAYYVSFGPHGPREPHHREGDGLKIVLGIVGVLGISGLLFSGLHSLGMYLLELEVPMWPVIFAKG